MAPVLEKAVDDAGSIETGEADQPAWQSRRNDADLTLALPLRTNLQRVVLTGFMGAGKSTVGRLLAQMLDWQFIDVDTAIETKAGMTVAEVFAKHGEFVFRRMETSAIAHALGERRCVIALGGGAPEVLANRLLLEQTPHTAVVLLEAPLATLLARCAAQQDAAVRPNLADPAAAEERFQYRAPLYRRCARHRFATAGQSPSQTVEAIRNTLFL